MNQLNHIPVGQAYLDLYKIHDGEIVESKIKQLTRLAGQAVLLCLLFNLIFLCIYVVYIFFKTITKRTFIRSNSSYSPSN